MNWISIPVLMMASVTFYVGIYYLWMFSKRRTDRGILSFSIVCFIIAFYDIFCAGLYNATTFTDGMFWQRLQFASIALLAIAILWFVYHYAGYKSKKIFISIATFFFLLLIMGLVIHNDLTLSLENKMPKHIVLGDFLDITIYEVDPGLIYIIQYISSMIGFLFLLITIVRDFIKGNRKILPIFLSFIIFFFAVINDVLVGAGVYSFIYLIEYMYMIIILSMAYILLNRFVNLYKEVEELNISLEKKVEERTEELQSAMEEMEAMNERLIDTNHSLEETQKIAAIDMNMAINVQRSLFLEEIPESDKWNLAFEFKPKAGVSGDFYDFYFKDGDLKGVSLFDVSGHGISSGLITVLAKSIMHRNISSNNFTGLGSIIKNINEELIKEIENVDNYLSGIIMLFNGSKIEYVNAGHSDLLIKRKENGAVKAVKPRDIEVKGGLLGLDTLSSTFDVIQFAINPGDVLFLFTDGLYESMNKQNEPFGLSRLMNTLGEAPSGNSSEILDFVLNRFYSFIDGNSPGDDITIIVLERK